MIAKCVNSLYKIIDVNIKIIEENILNNMFINPCLT